MLNGSALEIAAMNSTNYSNHVNGHNDSYLDHIEYQGAPMIFRKPHNPFMFLLWFVICAASLSTFLYIFFSVIAVIWPGFDAVSYVAHHIIENRDAFKRALHNESLAMADIVTKNVEKKME